MKGDRRAFVRLLAEELAGARSAEMSIRLELGSEDAKRWAKLRDVSPLMGWQNVDEAERQLAEWLFGHHDDWTFAWDDVTRGFKR
jgi:hypothetical protein